MVASIHDGVMYGICTYGKARIRGSGVSSKIIDDKCLDMNGILTIFTFTAGYIDTEMTLVLHEQTVVISIFVYVPWTAGQRGDQT